jgi:hypothetical protein
MQLTTTSFYMKDGKLHDLYNKMWLKKSHLCIVSFILLCFFSKRISYAQNFAQVNQFPLQLSPSMAGSKEVKRISIGANTVNYAANKNQTFAVSYDQMFKKLCVGGGVYYFQNNNNESFASSTSFEIPSTEKYRLQQSNKTIGFCIAPKYNLYDKKVYGKIKYTFSPSVFLEFGNEQFIKTYDINRVDYNSTIYSPSNPDGIEHTDSTVLNYNQYQLKNLFIRSGIGLLLNSKNLILLSKLSISAIEYNENLIENKIKDNADHVQNYNLQDHRIIYTFAPTIHIGYTIQTHPKSNFNLTPIIGIGMNHYFNFASTSTDSTEVYRYNISNSDITKLNYIHTSANFRFKYMLFGFAYTKYNDVIHKGITIGYQSKIVKIMLTGATNLNKNKAAYSNIEFTTSIFF